MFITIVRAVIKRENIDINSISTRNPLDCEQHNLGIKHLKYKKKHDRKNTEKGQNLKIHETQLKFIQIMSLCYYMTCYTRCIVATSSIHINNTKFYKGFKAIKTKIVLSE